MKSPLLLLILVFVSSCSAYLTDDDLDEMPIIISEIMYNMSDEADCEFIEIKNVCSKPIDLTGFTLSGSISYTFGSRTMEPQEFIIVTNSKTNFESFYPELSPIGEYIGDLSNSGDKITLRTSEGYKVTEVLYGTETPWPMFADGKYYSLVPIVSEPLEDQNSSDQWRLSAKEGGSPGADDPAREEVTVIVNEYFTGDDNDEGFIELYNYGSSTVDIGAWNITNTKDDLRMIELPTGISVRAGGYFIITESNIKDLETTTTFDFVNKENDIVLCQTSGGELTGYSSVLSTYYCDTLRSYGNYTTELSERVSSPLESITRGADNSSMLLGEIVFSQIMYHPKDGEYEFLVIENRTDEEVVLSATESSQLDNWKIRGISFNFDEVATIAGNSNAIFISGEVVDIETFRTKYSIDSEIGIYAYDGSLSNSNEKLELLKPEGLTLDDEGELVTNYSLSDQVHYYDRGDWPDVADGEGYSLIRKDRDSFGNCSSNWEKSSSNDGSPQL